ncbi:hypothetical protein [Pseudobutyrivibrio ruminis]|uniref:hypothetical protein n=1 Tax=Pseudobutyrivibrio ruminis TaxID=46206 RepID=UPI0003F5C3F4|nr:hypothetical protein [Pseudobutyrivibrio ruminis]
MYYSNIDFAYSFWNKDFAHAEKDKYYNVVIIGDSSSNSAYIPEILSDNTINLSVGGSSTVEGYLVLKDYLENNEAPTDVFLSYHDSHFKNTEAFWNMIVPSHRFKLMDNLEIVNRGRTDETDMFYHKNAISDLLLNQIYFPSKYITFFTNSIGQNRYEANVKGYDEAELHRGRVVGVGKTEFQTTQNRVYDDFLIEPMYGEYFEKTIKLCVDNNIAVHIVKPPLPGNTIMTDKYKKAVYDYYNQFITRYDNVSFDWIDKKYLNSKFADEIHLNNDGALVFTTTIKNRYVNLFNEKYTKNQMLGVDDYLTTENAPQYLFQFMKNKNYTILLHDSVGQIDKFNMQFLKPNDILLKSMVDDSGISNNLYDASPSIHDDEIEYEIKDEGTSAMVTFNGKKYRWNYLAEGVSAFIIDNSNQQLVGIKDIAYVKDIDEFSDYITVE